MLVLWIILGIVGFIALAFAIIALFMRSANYRFIRQIRAFENENPVTPEQRRWLAFGAPLAIIHHESLFCFKLKLEKLERKLMAPQEFKDDFAKKWGITNGEEAHAVLKELLEMGRDTDFANEVFAKFVLTREDFGKPFKYQDYTIFSITSDELTDLTGLEKSYETSLVMGKEVAKYYAAQDNITDEAEIEQMTQKLAMDYLAARITNSINSYGITLNGNVKFEKDAPEMLKTMQNFAAFDLGRVAYVARVCAALEYLQESEAWEYIKKAADTTSKMYNNWDEYIIAYCVGIALSGTNVEECRFDARAVYYDFMYDKRNPHQLRDVSFKQ